MPFCTSRMIAGDFHPLKHVELHGFTWGWVQKTYDTMGYIYIWIYIYGYIYIWIYIYMDIYIYGYIMIYCVYMGWTSINVPATLRSKLQGIPYGFWLRWWWRMHWNRLQRPLKKHLLIGDLSLIHTTFQEHSAYFSWLYQVISQSISTISHSSPISSGLY